MTWTLVRKLLRDVAVGLLLVCLLLGAFECLWVKVAQRIGELLIELTRAVPFVEVARQLFAGPGKIIQALMGGESIDLMRPLDRVSIGYVHPLAQTLLCVWAVGRSAGAIAGEIDRGTMELLLAQPVPRHRLILAHLGVDLLTIPVVCLSLWAGTWAGAWLTGQLDLPADRGGIDPLVFAPALLNAALLVFALSGYSLWVSSLGRFRGRVLGAAVLLTLVQFLVNVIGQLLEGWAFLRPYTVFYYYQPQPMALLPEWYRQAEIWQRLGVLLAVGTAGYLLALWTFCRRDLPAPL
jgi:ABC-2 type transport system permease protein